MRVDCPKGMALPKPMPKTLSSALIPQSGIVPPHGNPQPSPACRNAGMQARIHSDGGGQFVLRGDGVDFPTTFSDVPIILCRVSNSTFPTSFISQPRYR